MTHEHHHILADLQKEILALQGFKPKHGQSIVDLGLDAISDAFPNQQFPLGVIHEFITESREERAASGGFLAGIVGKLMSQNRVCLWVSSNRLLFPPALKQFEIEPHKIIFVDLNRDKDVLWVMEEALKCEALSAVVGELRDLDFTASRRLQLAVEKSKVTGFVIRHLKRKVNTTASVTRWRISHLPSEIIDQMPGIGFPRWKVELLKVRNGKPSTWEITWMNNKFHVEPKAAIIQWERKKKTG